MTKKRRFPGLPGQGYRAPETGKDVNLGNYEARIRGQVPIPDDLGLGGPVVSAEEEAQQIIVTDKSSSKGSLWSNFLTPISDWAFYESLRIVNDTTLTTMKVLSVTVPKGQIFIVKEWTPVALIEIAANQYEEVDPYYFFPRVYASLGGRTDINAQSSVGVDSLDGTTTGTGNGSFKMNTLAYRHSDGFPMAMVATEGDEVEVNYSFYTLSGSNWVSGAVSTLPGGSADALVFGVRLLGFYMPKSKFEDIQRLA